MFRSKTVFVIGAGASAEIKLPAGAALASMIANLTNIHLDSFGRTAERGDPQIVTVLKKLIESDPEWRSRASTIVKSGQLLAEAMAIAPSIDTFLHSHRENPEYVLLGKLGIAKAILNSERDSLLFQSLNGVAGRRMNSLHATWYVSLAQQLFSGIDRNEPSTSFENVQFIVFNYDRCLEVFLLSAIQMYFSLTHNQAADIVKNSVEIIHPYGDLGDIFSSDRRYPKFGDPNCDLLYVAENLLTFSETIKDPIKIARIKQLMTEAETLVFLGFAFHDQNMELLGDGLQKTEKKSNVKRVFATTFKVSPPDVTIIRNEIGHLIRGRPPKASGNDYRLETFSGECSYFFGEYWRSLTAST